MPTMVADLRGAAVPRFIDFFSTNIRNQSTGGAGRRSGGSAGHDRAAGMKAQPPRAGRGKFAPDLCNRKVVCFQRPVLS